MKIINNDNIILYLKKEYLEKNNIENLEDIDSNFKEIFEKLKEYYNLKINGFYDINIYSDINYGIVIVLKKELIDYDYYDNQVDMKINYYDTKFLYKITDLYNFINNKIYVYKNKYYIEKNDNIEFLELEYNTDDIIKYGKIIDI